MGFLREMETQGIIPLSNHSGRRLGCPSCGRTSLWPSRWFREKKSDCPELGYSCLPHLTKSTNEECVMECMPGNSGYNTSNGLYEYKRMTNGRPDYKNKCGARL